MNKFNLSKLTLMMVMLLSYQNIKSNNKKLLLSNLESKLVWQYFADISDIPRASGNEEGVANYILNEAKLLNLEARKDNVGNIIVRKPASSDLYKHAPIVVIQSHMDMVCEKNKNIQHDFAKDPIKFVLKDNFLYADGTTLGADNGIGVAASLALMKSVDLIHGPLEFLFTVMEESGFDGAYNVNEGTIKGRILLNIDTEEEGSIYIGCAGCDGASGKLPIQREKLSNSKFVSITIDGLRGGHSGVDIDKDRVNALKVAAIILNKLNAIDYSLVSINGGNKLNAIPRDVELVIAVNENINLLFDEVIDRIINNTINDLQLIEKNLVIKKNNIESEDEVFTKESKDKVIELLNNLPHGVVKMSKIIDNLVDTSTNFAKISTSADYVLFETTQRSLTKSELSNITRSVADLFSKYDAALSCGLKSPEWEPNENSKILKLAKDTYLKLFNKPADIKAIHAGLECGAFVNQVPGLDTISFGPTIHDAHSPNEHIDVKTVQPFWQLLTKLLEEVAKN